MAARVREGRMDTDEAIAESFVDCDSDISDLSHSEFKPSDSEESEQKEEEGGEEEASIDRRNWISKCTWSRNSPGSCKSQPYNKRMRKSQRNSF